MRSRNKTIEKRGGVFILQEECEKRENGGEREREREMLAIQLQRRACLTDKVVASTPFVAIAKLIVLWRCTVPLHDYVLVALYMCITALVLSCIILAVHTQNPRYIFPLR